MLVLLPGLGCRGWSCSVSPFVVLLLYWVVPFVYWAGLPRRRTLLARCWPSEAVCPPFGSIHVHQVWWDPNNGAELVLGSWPWRPSSWWWQCPGRLVALLVVAVLGLEVPALAPCLVTVANLAAW